MSDSYAPLQQRGIQANHAVREMDLNIDRQSGTANGVYHLKQYRYNSGLLLEGSDRLAV